jgi:acyl-coenzyme A thioesterase PaaI-like protein
MIKPLNQRVLRCVIGHRSGPHFGDVLGIQDARLLLPQSTATDDGIRARSVQFQYRVPARLCVHVPGAATIAQSKPELALSAAVALFDELSTRGLVLEDRHFRPGVSVHLSGQLHRTAHADDEVTITTTSEKIGANLGFCTITMHSSKDSVLLYSGRHIKYLPMGRAWDRVMGSKPLVKALLAVVDDESGTTVNKLFGKRARALLFPRSGKSTSSAGADMDNATEGAFHLLDVAQQDNSTSNYILTPGPTPLLNNPLGRTHGGALALAVEKSHRLHFHNSRQNHPASYRMESMELSYLNASRVRAHEKFLVVVLLTVICVCLGKVNNKLQCEPSNRIKH